jgi:hypothetical protein
MKRSHYSRASRVCAGIAVFLAVLFAVNVARAETRTYVLAIGNNAPPVGPNPEGLPTLKYADDDAAAFYTFTQKLAREAVLLSVLDATTQKRFPDVASKARVPSLAELRRTIADLKRTFERDRADGHEAVLLFFFSGHGTRAGDRAAALALSDGPLTTSVLYDEILAPLPARHIHLFVDACFAESVVRPRDGEAQTVDLTAADLATATAKTSLARFPHVGALVAASTTARTFEWDALERGVFTHELLSGLRGGADVNGDGRIEYSEIVAFIAAANREVNDSRAKLAIVSRAPPLDPRAPLVDLARLRGHGTISGKTAHLGRFSIEDELGNRLLDVNAESGFDVALRIPATRVFLRGTSGEVALDVREGGRIALASLALKDSGRRARGSVEEAFGRGVFAAPFGPQYYRAYTDADATSVPVTFTNPPVVAVFDGPSVGDAPRSSLALPIAIGATGVLAGATVVSSILMFSAKSDFEGARFERDASDARDRYGTLQTVSIVGLVATAVAAGVTVYLLVR